MNLMVWTLLTYSGFAVFSLFLAVLPLPFRIHAAGTAHDRKGFGYELAIDWAFGLFSIMAADGKPMGLYFAGLRVWRFSLGSEKKKGAEKEPKEKKRSPLAILGWIKKHFQQIQSILRRFVRASLLKGYLIGQIGLADPADTAQLSVLCNLLKIRKDRFNLAIICVYDREIVNIKAKLQATLVIGYLVLVAIGLLLEKETRVMLRTLPQT